MSSWVVLAIHVIHHFFNLGSVFFENEIATSLVLDASPIRHQLVATVSNGSSILESGVASIV